MRGFVGHFSLRQKYAKHDLDQAVKKVKTEKTEKTEKSQTTERNDTTEKSMKTEKMVKTEKIEEMVTTEKPTQAEKPEMVDKKTQTLLTTRVGWNSSVYVDEDDWGVVDGF